MEKLVIGKYVNTHGVKGEIRIKSNFKYKNKVFITGNKIYIEDREYIIKTYRIHKEYDMITLEGINNINDILKFKGSIVYIDKDSLNLNKFEYLDSDLIGYSVYMDKKLKGNIENIEYINNNKKLLKVNGTLVPFELVKNIDFNSKKIILEKVEGLL